MCYYLHLAINNIIENKDRIKSGRETINNCINSWGKNRTIIVPGTEPYLRDVLVFLRNNVENIRLIIFPCTDDWLIMLGTWPNESDPEQRMKSVLAAFGIE